MDESGGAWRGYIIFEVRRGMERTGVAVHG